MNLGEKMMTETGRTVTVAFYLSVWLVRQVNSYIYNQIILKTRNTSINKIAELI